MSKEISLGRVSLTDKALLAKHLSLLLRSGLTLTDALAVAIESSRGKLKTILESVLQSVQSGQTFSLALSAYPKVFSGLFINTIYVGESSGNLSENLENIAKELEKEKELSSKVKSAMIYPIAVLVITFILGLALSFIVLPKIVPLFQGLTTDLPLSTRLLISFSNVMDNYGFEIFLGLIVLIVFLIWFLKQKFLQPITHWTLLHLPILSGPTHYLNLARFTRSLASLLGSGQNIISALETSEKSLNNIYYRRALKQVTERVSGGGRLSEALGYYPNLFPILLVKMVRVSEESGKFEETLFYLSNFYELELNKTTKNLSTTIEPIMLLLIGLVVAGLALAIITPIYEITGNIRR